MAVGQPPEPANVLLGRGVFAVGVVLPFGRTDWESTAHARAVNWLTVFLGAQPAASRPRGCVPRRATSWLKLLISAAKKTRGPGAQFVLQGDGCRTEASWGKHHVHDGRVHAPVP